MNIIKFKQNIQNITINDIYPYQMNDKLWVYDMRPKIFLSFKKDKDDNDFCLVDIQDDGMWGWFGCYTFERFKQQLERYGNKVDFKQ